MDKFKNLKLRVHLNSYDVSLLNESYKKILETTLKEGGFLKGIIPLPTKKRIYCVLRSPHVDKDSREHFEIRVHRRLLEIEKLSPQIINAFCKLHLPAGIDIRVQFIVNE
uniref:Ribosomal protein S10 n=1 Tax=Gloeochaete wittrockiana TaxID=38269 RepID=A0A3G1IW24_9EUKA|nr:ribosomal protein S10 [Gloeochaete wittrockiana]ASQ40258.1 ribosomal protein S10 [Gloeochaete wittrockiana]